MKSNNYHNNLLPNCDCSYFTFMIVQIAQSWLCKLHNHDCANCKIMIVQISQWWLCKWCNHDFAHCTVMIVQIAWSWLFKSHNHKYMENAWMIHNCMIVQLFAQSCLYKYLHNHDCTPNLYTTSNLRILIIAPKEIE